MFFKKSKAAKKVEEKPLTVRNEPCLTLMVYQQARISHENWVADKIKQGYIYGPVMNDDPQKGQLTNPLIIPYDKLDVITKQNYIADAIALIKIMRKNGL